MSGVVHYFLGVFFITEWQHCYGKRSFLSKESDTLRSHRIYISPTMQASSALIEIADEFGLMQMTSRPSTC